MSGRNHHLSGWAALGALVLAGSLLVGCGSSGGDSSSGTTTSTTAAPSTTAKANVTTTTVAPATTTTAAGATTTTAPANGLKPGDPCSLEEGSPDCIDPDGDGNGVYLIGGADCIANSPDPALCADLDGDGHAGYPDAG